MPPCSQNRTIVSLRESSRRCTLGCLLAFVAMAARAAAPDWTVDEHDYQCDMTAFVSLSLDHGDEAVGDLSRYTIAAFCGDVCRGVMEVRTAGDGQYGYLRIRSNTAEGEVITFQVYDADDDFLLPCADSLIFASLDVRGVPSSPYLLQAESKSYVNEQEYAVLTQQIATAQAALDAAKDSVEASCPDVASDFADRIAAIQAAIDAINMEVEAQYQAVSLTYESGIDTDGILHSAQQLVVDALLAQRVHENEEAYARLTAEIETVQAELDAATDSINTACGDVADDYAASLAAIQAAIDALTTDVAALYTDTLLTHDSAIDTADIVAAIDSLLADASLAQRVFENEQAYQSLLSQLDEAQAQLDAAADSLAASCPDVAEEFAADFDNLQTVIDSLRTDLSERYASLDLNAGTTIDLSELAEAIDALLRAAIDAQAEFTAISSTTLDSTEAPCQYLTLDGRLVPGTSPGHVTIIRYADGTCKKVMTK